MSAICGCERECERFFESLIGDGRDEVTSKSFGWFDLLGPSD